MNETIRIKDSEKLNDYVIRISELFDNFPENVIEEWLHRHNKPFMDKFSHHELNEWIFTLRNISEIEFMKIDLFSNAKVGFLDIGRKLLGYPENKETEPGKFMIEHGTFPSPIIVFEDFSDFVDHTGEHYKSPYHLAEGHKRWGYLNTMIKHKNQHFQNLKNRHYIYYISRK